MVRKSATKDDVGADVLSSSVDDSVGDRLLSDVGIDVTAVGDADGISVGDSDGAEDGPEVGRAVVGDFDGIAVGLFDGLHFRVGIEDGVDDGFLDGAPVGD